MDTKENIWKAKEDVEREMSKRGTNGGNKKAFLDEQNMLLDLYLPEDLNENWGNLCQHTYITD